MVLSPKSLPLASFCHFSSESLPQFQSTVFMYCSLPVSSTLAIAGSVHRISVDQSAVMSKPLLGTTDALLCSSPFVWNSSPDSGLRTAGDSFSSPYLESVHNPHFLRFPLLICPQPLVHWLLLVSTVAFLQFLLVSVNVCIKQSLLLKENLRS